MRKKRHFTLITTNIMAKANTTKVNQNACISITLASTWKLLITKFQVLIIVLIIFFISALHFTSKNRVVIIEEEGQMMPKCDYFKGKWVYDNESYPLYKEKECSFMSDQLACHKFGRQDLSYQFWKWQPHHCDLPRFNATTLLEALRNRRLVFVGDSINRGQWTSMVCLVEQAIPNTSLKIMETNGSLFTFKAIEYNASIDFYWAPLLVESNSDHPGTSGLQERIVRTQAIEKHARHWDDAHILVFDSYLWWRRETMKVLWGSFEEEDGIYKEIEMLKGYEMALRTWSDWLEIHVNHSNSRIFWMTQSPMHGSAEYWGGESGSNCYNETQPIAKQLYPDESGGLEQKMMQLVEAETNSLITKGVNIQVVDITLLSKYRKEAHPSIHKRQWQPLTKHQLKNPTSYADCFHWCLPGVPDIWNQILYAYLFI